MAWYFKIKVKQENYLKPRMTFFGSLINFVQKFFIFEETMSSSKIFYIYIYIYWKHLGLLS